VCNTGRKTAGNRYFDDAVYRLTCVKLAHQDIEKLFGRK